MTHPLCIAVADDEPDMRDYFVRILPTLGYEVVAVAGDGRELVRQCHASRPDLLIVDIKMPEMDGIAAAEEICRDQPVPVILVSAHQDPELIERAACANVMAYLIKPIKQADLEPAITIAVRRFERLQALLQETTDLQRALDDRKIIERAKGILARRSGIDEQRAFRRLQRLASERNQKMAEIAQMIVTAEEALAPPARRSSRRETS